MIEELDLNKAKKIALKCLGKAGKIVKRGYFDEQKKVKFKNKEKTDIVTEYDVLAENEMVKEIKKNFPNHNFLTEELGSEYKHSDYTWIIDPIDGTRNYFRKIPIFMIGIALALGDNVIMSMSFNPVTKDLYYAQKGEGAYLNGKRIYVSKNKLKDSDVDVQIARSFKDLRKDVFFRLVHDVYSIRNFYSLIYSSDLVASGNLDALVSVKSHPWDYCSYLLIEEAGGKVTDFNGDKFDLSKDNVVMSNKLIHKQILEKLRGLEYD